MYILNEEDLQEQIKQRRIALFLWDIFSSAEYPFLVAELAERIKNGGGSLVLITKNYIDEPIINQVLMHASMKDKRKAINSYYLHLEEKLHVKVIVLDDQLRCPEDKKMIAQLRNFNQIATFNPELYLSMKSLWLSKNQITLKNEHISRRLEKSFRLDLVRYCDSLGIAQSQIRNSDFDLILVPNGRLPIEIAVKHAAVEFDKRFLFFERGFAGTKKIFLQEFQTHDISRMNEYFELLASELSFSEVKNASMWSEQWLERQHEQSGSNQFFDLKRSVRLKVDYKDNLVPIFTSSIDERFSNLTYDLNGWSSPTEACVQFYTWLLENDMSPVIRIHPNAGWKSWRELLELVAAFEKNAVKFILPWENPSSYELIEYAKFVVTWGSTLSLESLARGIKTMNLGPSRFDSLARIKLVSKEDCERFRLAEIPEPDTTRAHLAIYLTRNHGVGSKSYTWIQDLTDACKPSAVQAKVNIFCQMTKNLICCLIFPLTNRPNDIFIPLKKVLGYKIAGFLMYRIMRCIKFLT
jgi:hypothetical protein